MNRFLKKEWEDTEIPEQVYLRARKRAWARLQGRPSSPKPAGWKWAYAAACLCGIALVVLLALLTQTPDPATVAGKRTMPDRVDAPQSLPDQARNSLERQQKEAPTDPDSDLLSQFRERMRPPQAGPHGAKTSVGAHRVRPIERAASDSSAPDRQDLKDAHLPSRIVLNFQLPETGVRMIWIIDKDFDLDGGT